VQVSVLTHLPPLARIQAGSMLARIPKHFSHRRHLSIWLCHDENQKHQIQVQRKSGRRTGELNGSLPVLLVLLCCLRIPDIGRFSQ
jgi:hypothetical protein